MPTDKEQAEQKTKVSPPTAKPKKRKRRGVGLALLLLLVLVCFALYYGVQRHLGGTGRAVFIYRKSHRFQPELLEQGKLYWFWERLVPGFFSRQDFPLEVQQLQLNLEYQLPQAELYQEFAVGRPDFSYDIQLTLSYQLSPDEVLTLVQGDPPLAPDDLPSFYKKQESILRQALLQGFTPSLPSNPGEAEEELRRLAQQQIGDQLQVLGVALQRYQVPDLTLYRAARENYVAFNKKNGNQLLQNNILRSLMQEDTEAQLDNLHKLGETLKQYPNVLDYLDLFDGADPRWQLPPNLPTTPPATNSPSPS